MNAQEFNKLASDTSKNYRLEAFSFTFDFGLNIYFDSLDDLHAIIGDTEIEFWQLEDQSQNAEYKVNSFAALAELLEFIENNDQAVAIELFLQLIDEGYAKHLEGAKDWHEENYFCEAMDDYDFGHYLMHDVNGVEIPEALEGYIDYSAYGRDAKINDFVVIDDCIYWNR